MTIRKKRINLRTVSMLIALLLLSTIIACAPAQGPEPEQSPAAEEDAAPEVEATTEEAAPTEAPEPTAEPTEEQEPADTGDMASSTLFVGWGQQSDNLDPQTARGNRNWWVLAELYDTLTVLPEQSLKAEPYLAESWEVSEDGLEYTFKLRQGITFSTGREMTAEDVKFSMDRLQTIGRGPLYMTEGVYESTEVIDDYTVKFTLQHPFSAWPEIISQPAVLGIADREAVLEHCGEPEPDQQCDWLSTNSAGAGAYVVEEFVPNERTVLTRNPEYWQGWDGNHLDRIVWESIPEEATRILRLERGDLDIAAVSAAGLPSLEQRIEDQSLPLRITKTNDEGEPLLSLSKLWINLNNQILPTSDYNVRRALIHSFNYDLYIERVLQGYGTRLKGMIPEGVICHVEDYPSYEYDLELAQEFLDKASPEAKAELENGLRLPYRPDGVIKKEGALMWQADLAKIGITLNVEEVDSATLADLQTSAPGVPIIEARWFADYPHPDNFINAAWTEYWPPNGYGSAFAGDEHTDELIQQGRVETDPEKRCEIYRELELYFHEQAPIINLAQISGVINEWNVQNTAVQGFEYNPMIHPIYYNMSKEQ